MKTEKTTAWFPNTVNPVRKGFYQVFTPNCGANTYSYWNGSFWELCTVGRYKSGYDKKSRDMRKRNSQWRGLTKPAS